MLSGGGPAMLLAGRCPTVWCSVWWLGWELCGRELCGRELCGRELCGWGVARHALACGGACGAALFGRWGGCWANWMDSMRIFIARVWELGGVGAGRGGTVRGGAPACLIWLGGVSTMVCDGSRGGGMWGGGVLKMSSAIA